MNFHAPDDGVAADDEYELDYIDSNGNRHYLDKVADDTKEPTMSDTLAAELDGAMPQMTFKARMTAVVTQCEQVLAASKALLAAAEKHLDAVKAAARELE